MVQQAKADTTLAAGEYRSPRLAQQYHTPVQLAPARRIDLVAQFSGAFDLAEGQPIGHAARVAHLALAFGRRLKLDGGSRRRLLYAALLHDAGVAVREVPSTVDPVGGHTAAGAWVASLMGLDEETQHVIQCTHERWDGEGRPHRLAMSDVPVEALAIVAAHWVTDKLGPQENPLRARATLRSFQPDDLESLVGVRIAQATLSELNEDHVWMSLWDDDLVTRLTERVPGEGRPAMQHVERVAAAIGKVVDSAVRENGRSQRVADLASALARQLGLDALSGHALHAAGLVMGIGQLGVPRHITEKPALLSIDEMEMMRRHSGWASQLLEGIPGFEELALWVEAHHERPDGRGYPNLLSAAEIPFPARILAVADTYWALRAERPYRAALSEHDATAVIEQATGTQFDASVASVLRRALRSVAARDAEHGGTEETTMVSTQ